MKLVFRPNLVSDDGDKCDGYTCGPGDASHASWSDEFWIDSMLPLWKRIWTVYHELLHWGMKAARLPHELHHWLDRFDPF